MRSLAWLLMLFSVLFVLFLFFISSSLNQWDRLVGWFDWFMPHSCKLKNACLHSTAQHSNSVFSNWKMFGCLLVSLQIHKAWTGRLSQFAWTPFQTHCISCIYRKLICFIYELFWSWITTFRSKSRSMALYYLLDLQIRFMWRNG